MLSNMVKTYKTACIFELICGLSFMFLVEIPKAFCIFNFIFVQKINKKIQHLERM